MYSFDENEEYSSGLQEFESAQLVNFMDEVYIRCEPSLSLRPFILHF